MLAPSSQMRLPGDTRPFGVRLRKPIARNSFHGETKTGKFAMAIGNLPACLPITLKHEGGYTNNRADRGNWTSGKVGVGVLKGTKYGIAAHAYPNLDIKNLTVNDVKPIYEKDYWKPARCENLPYGVDLAVFDFAVNSGVSRSVKYLQSVVGAKQDGKAGNETVTKTAALDGKAVIQKLSAKRLSFVQGIPNFSAFIKGVSRRVADIEAKAVSMWLARGGATTREVSKELQQESAKAQDVAKSQNNSAGGAGGSGVAVGGGDAIVNGGPSWIGIAIFAVLVTAAIVLVVKSRQNKQRSEAYQSVAVAL